MGLTVLFPPPTPCMRGKIWLITFAYFLPCGYYVCSYHDCVYLNYQVGSIHAYLIIVQVFKVNSHDN